MLIKRKTVKEDELTRLITRITAFYYHNPKRFLLIVGIVIVIIGVAVFQIQSARKSIPELDLGFTQALGYYTTGKLSQAEQQFFYLARKYRSKRLGIKSWYYLGNIYFQTRRFNEAKKAFELFYKKWDKSSILAPASLMGIANSLEEMGNLQQAIRYYKEVYEKYKESPWAPLSLLGAGRCYKTLGDLYKAEEVYKKIVKEYSENNFALTQAKAELAAIKTIREEF